MGGLGKRSERREQVGLQELDEITDKPVVDIRREVIAAEPLDVDHPNG
jgi:hypothetical protein